MRRQGNDEATTGNEEDAEDTEVHGNRRMKIGARQRMNGLERRAGVHTKNFHNFGTVGAIAFPAFRHLCQTGRMET